MVAAPASPRAVAEYLHKVALMSTGDDAVRAAGEAAWADYLRRMLAVATQ
jgi:hypothetical protein